MAAVAENGCLNKALAGLHTSAAELRRAIADARALQMHLQQEAADARETQNYREKRSSGRTALPQLCETADYKVPAVV